MHIRREIYGIHKKIFFKNFPLYGICLCSLAFQLHIILLYNLIIIQSYYYTILLLLVCPLNEGL